MEEHVELQSTKLVLQTSASSLQLMSQKNRGKLVLLFTKVSELLKIAVTSFYNII